MSAPPPVRAADLINGAVHELQEAQRIVRELQAKVIHDPWLWGRLETIDDRLHDALGKLGD